MNEPNGSPPGGNPPGGGDTAAAAAASAATAPWYGKDAKPEVAGFLEAKGWKDNPLGLVDSYQQLEAFMGADKAGRGIVIPKDTTDTAAWDAVYNKLGRPEKPEGYGLKPPEGQPPDFLNAAMPVLHKLGISRVQAEGLNKFLTEHGTAEMAKLDAKAKSTVEAEQAALKNEWGTNHDKNIAIGQRAAAALGVTEAEINGVEAALGHTATMKLFARMGEKLGEDVLNIGDPGSKGSLTVEGAKARLKMLAADTDWVQRWEKGGAAEKAEKERLDRIVAGMPQAA